MLVAGAVVAQRATLHRLFDVLGLDRGIRAPRCGDLRRQLERVERAARVAPGERDELGARLRPQMRALAQTPLRIGQRPVA